MGNIKDLLTTIAGLVVLVGTAIKTYLDSVGGGDINWFALLAAVAVAVIGFFTGRNPNGSAKNNPVNV